MRHATLISLPEDLRIRLELALTSPLEGRVPKGEWQKFFVARILEWFNWGTLSLEPYGFPAGYFVKGPPEMLTAVRKSFQARRLTNKDLNETALEETIREIEQWKRDNPGKSIQIFGDPLTSQENTDG